MPSNDFIDRSQSFDDVNNLLSSRVEVDEDDASDLITRYAYDGNDQLAVVQQPEGNRAFHVYDERRLRFKTSDATVEIIRVRPFDVATMVAFGARTGAIC